MSVPRPEAASLKSPRKISVTERQLTGGLHVLTARRSEVPLVEVRLVFPMSGRQMSRPADSLVGSESLLAGTAEHDRIALAEAVGRLGGSLGASSAGDNFVLYGSSFADRYRQLLSLMAEVLTSATYPAGEVEGDRDRSADEITLALSRPETIASEALSHRLYGSHPYGVSLPRPEAVAEVTPARLKRLHSSLLRPGGAHLVVVGDLTPARAAGVAEEVLGDWLSRAGKATAALPRLPRLEAGPLELVDRRGSVQSNIRIAGRMPGRLDPDWPALAVANAILGGMFTSRLVENLRERNGYTYSPHSLVHHMRAGSTGTIGADVSTGVTAAALVEARYEIARLATAGVTEAELEAARRYLVGIFLFQTATQSALASTLGALAATGVEPEYLTSHPARLARVTKQEVDEAAARYFSPARLVTVVVGDGNAIAEPLLGLEEVDLAEAPA